ncbi:MAG: ROK family protein [Armatimonadetes bacterium]|nr:ROK family protein [Armatimonadota bacterium]
MGMQSGSPASANSARRRQKSAERTNVSLLRYVLDHPGATCKAAAKDLAMSLPNVFRLVAGFKESGLIVGRQQKQTGRRGPWSQVMSLRSSLGATIGVDVEATNVRGVVLDFANEVVAEMRHPLPPSAGPEEIVSAAAGVALSLVGESRRRSLEACAVGLGLPGPVNDVTRGSVRTELQFGKASLEFVPLVESKCGLPVTSAGNAYCFTAGHHRIHKPRGTGIEMVVLNRFGLAATLIWDGRLYTGASHYAGDLGLLPYGSHGRRYSDVCTGSSLLKWARRHGDDRSFYDLLRSPDDPLVREWLGEAVPAFIQTICNAVVIYNPNSVLIEGLFNRFSEETRRRILDGALDEISRIGNMLPEIAFFDGDDLMGARGAALMARDSVADQILSRLLIPGS